MKKHIIKLCLVVFATLLFFSCNDEFLERFPLDRISSETFWTSANDLEVFNNSLYNRIRDDRDVDFLVAHQDGYWSSRISIWYLDEFSDNIAPRHSRTIDYQKVRAGKFEAQTGARWYGWHSDGWRLVREIAVGMEGSALALENGVNQAEVNKYLAEQRLFRGIWYARKAFKFGNVPWIEAPLNIDSEQLYGPRTPKADVMANVMEDLNFACANLPDDWGVGATRLNRGAALLMKSRICLMEGTWRKYHGTGDANSWLQAAADAAKELMDGGNYSLYTTGDTDNDYQAMHKMLDLSGVSEVIHYRKYQAGIGMSNHVQSYHRGYNGGATKSIVEDYLCTDGKPITLSDLYMGDEVYENIFENRDPRLRQTILHPADVARWDWNKNDERLYPRIDGMEGGIKSTTGYHICKVYESGAAHATYNTSSTPAIIMRYAEALLNYAEAKEELGQLDQAVLDMTVNALRDRAGMPHLTMGATMDPRYAHWGVSAELVEIRRERRVELFMEGFRYDDLRRWKLGKELENPDLGMRWDAANSGRFDPAGDATIKTKTVDGVIYLAPYVGTDWEGPVFDEGKHYLWPLPLGAIAQNPELGQNPGY
ncbi:MAG: RagB/SusD family nutrient uptake outer membrane protein [Prolixibacteraceae bacterium]|jgi:starch-binding outer membrane protein, SusD/RagB family|nr:RagB/SusD family nutrient uptake outer membrane protein [Prolixibacteraceae bacterium]MBT6999293.1 RagB/SusD family nutrient uptake outer membrane protein [Prolixibacteraceae bacterium]